MSILSFLQSKKIIPTKKILIENEARAMAKRISNENYWINNMTNEDLVFFANEFRTEVTIIITDRLRVLEENIDSTNKAIQNIK